MTSVITSGRMTDGPARKSNEADSARLLRRLLGLAWRYRRQCVAVFAFQVVLLAFGVFGLGLSGLAIDVTRHALEPSTPPPHFPLGFTPPAWSTFRVLLLLGGL